MRICIVCTLASEVLVAPTLQIDALTFVGFDYIDFMAYSLLLQHLPRGGVFFEAGATDGLYGSNTWFLGKLSSANSRSERTWRNRADNRQRESRVARRLAPPARGD
eukprot:3947174-Prymnesium_polylepis.1